MSDPLLTLRTAPARRWFGVVMLGGLAVMVAGVLAVQPPQSLWAIVLLIVIGGFAAREAWNMHMAREKALLLYEDRLTDEGGQVLVTLEDVLRVDRGVFALKPSNGFALVLRQRAPRAAVRGLWSRSGRRFAVGGAAEAQTIKNMADAIQTMLAIRDEAA